MLDNPCLGLPTFKAEDLAVSRHPVVGRQEHLLAESGLNGFGWRSRSSVAAHGFFSCIVRVNEPVLFSNCFSINSANLLPSTTLQIRYPRSFSILKLPEGSRSIVTSSTTPSSPIVSWPALDRGNSRGHSIWGSRLLKLRVVFMYPAHTEGIACSSSSFPKTLSSEHWCSCMPTVTALGLTAFLVCRNSGGHRSYVR